jgi:hypothetical protein
MLALDARAAFDTIDTAGTPAIDTLPPCQARRLYLELAPQLLGKRRLSRRLCEHGRLHRRGTVLNQPCSGGLEALGHKTGGP